MRSLKRWVPNPVSPGEDAPELPDLQPATQVSVIFPGPFSDPGKLAESQRTGIPVPGLHSALFAPVASPTIRTGVLAMSAAVLDLMKK